jgi:glycosyltransferase involved in cell wall biosynthesis
LSQTRRCVESVLAHRQATPFEIVAVDDASPEADITSYLDGLAGAGRITLVRNERNLGFVQSVNRGMSLHADRDVVLLNSDTEVANDWLDRLCRSAYASPDVGTVTPFSNNATICSYPFEGWTGGLPGTLGVADLDRLFASTNAGRTVDLPTGVGFCMLIRRACLGQIGPFDAERFGRGYGEENDFCMRAAGAGWRNVLAGDVFVYHEGAVSFSGERLELTTSAGKTLMDLYPDYARKVREYVRDDPAGPLRAAVDNARIVQRAEELPHVLAERIEERTLLKARLVEAEVYADEREPLIAKLREGLALAETLLAERDAEIERLRSGLAHAEKLAFERAHELEELQRSWIWKARVFMARRKTRRAPHPPA